ncbi:MAG: GNAT family N-acetyltransferase [Chitinophagaceae bacterium]|jgi:N-acetylglutamate synthase-like GNAT family acetyltransferase|nr:GNAT family N-acetyltransferase [Chitinophagaceae bacterium]
MLSIKIREAKFEDAEVISRLSTQLGYPANEMDIQNNLLAIASTKLGNVFVAYSENTVTGWIYLYRHTDLSTGKYMEIMGLVVDEAHRSKGIGAQLIQYTINICKKENIKQLVLRSRVTRTSAHRFYRNLRFVEIKEQKVFSYDFNKY